MIPITNQNKAKFSSNNDNDDNSNDSNDNNNGNDNCYGDDYIKMVIITKII